MRGEAEEAGVPEEEARAGQQACSVRCIKMPSCSCQVKSKQSFALRQVHALLDEARFASLMIHHVHMEGADPPAWQQGRGAAQ